MRKSFKFAILTLAAVISISTIVFAYSLRADIIRSVSPDLHFEMTLNNTLRILESEINSIQNNELISRLDEILSGDFNINTQVNLDAFADHESRWYTPLPQITADFTSSRWNRALAFGLDVDLSDTEYDDFRFELGTYFTNERFIVRFFDESLFLNARDPFGDIKAFDELNELNDDLSFFEFLFDLIGNDLSYDNIRRLVFDTPNFSLSDETMRQLNFAYRNLFRNSRISVGHRELEFNRRLANRDVTTVIMSAEILNNFTREVITILLNDEDVRELIGVLYRLNFPTLMHFGWVGFMTPSVDTIIDFLLEEVQQLEIFEHAMVLDFIESNDRYVGVVIAMQDSEDRIEFGALGQRNMLDYIHFATIHDFGGFRASIVGDNVRTNHFRSEFIFEDRFMLQGGHNSAFITSINFDWDTTSRADNFSWQVSNTSYRDGEITRSSTSIINGTFALTPARDILFYVLSAQGNNENSWGSSSWSHNLTEHDLRISIRRFTGRMNIPERPREFRNMTTGQIESLINSINDQMYMY